jgi:hypothetical protein
LKIKIKSKAELALEKALEQRGLKKGDEKDKNGGKPKKKN